MVIAAGVFDPVLFGQRVTFQRKACGFTQLQLAERIGATQSWIHAIERGKRAHLQAATVVRLCLALTCRSDYLLGLTEGGDPCYS